MAFNAKKFKEHQAQAWGRMGEVYDYSFSTLGHPASSQMIEEVRLKKGEALLDVAAGTGIDAFLALPKLGAEGSILGIDIAKGMVDVANAKVQARRMHNVRFEIMDAEKMTLENNSFDAAVCKWGLAIMPDANKCLKEILRVLKPGGRFSALVFGRPEGSQFVTTGARAAFKLMPQAVTHEAGAPSDFRFAPEGALDAAFNSAGFTNVRSRRFVLMMVCESGERYWDLFTNGVANFNLKLTKMQPAMRESIRAEVIAAVERYQSPDGIRLPLEVVCGYGEKPRGRASEKESASVGLLSLDDMSARAGKKLSTITCDDLQTILDDDKLVVLDIRDKTDFEKGHIPRSRSCPRNRLEFEVANVVPADSARQVVVVSNDDRIGNLAGKTLVDIGYENVSTLVGGFQNWSNAHLQVETGAAQ